MEMGAVRDDYSLEERAVKAVNAGTDLLVFNVTLRDPELGTKLHAIIANAVCEGASRGHASRRPTARSCC